MPAVRKPISVKAARKYWHRRRKADSRKFTPVDKRVRQKGRRK